MTNIKNIIKNILGYDSFQQKQWLTANQFHATEFEWGFNFNNDNFIIGILWDFAQEHKNYIQACIDLKVNYKVVDVRGADWISKIEESSCDIFLIWPTIYKPIHKQFWDERVWVINTLLKKKVFPSKDIMWLYESKRRTAYWLKINNIEHPATWIFFDKKQALEFIENQNLPIISKTDQGASSSGVFVLRNKSATINLINRAFKSGIKLKNKSIYDRHKDYVFFQEYLENCKEWRIIRVGDSFFCRYKIKVGDFHSGSGDIVWASPPRHLLDKTREISNQFDVPNLNVDFFETSDGRFLVNELHALWGGKVLHDEELEGRYIFNETSHDWIFEKGDFFKNRCANLRLKWVVENWKNHDV